MPNAAPHRRPNLLFIMDDQHRHDYLGCAGADWLRTPTLDALAARGTRFTQCITNAPVCTPSRIALATGLQAHRFGGGHNNVFLPQTRRTYYQRLRDSGYRVGCVGKLDLAKPAGDNSDGARPATFSWGFTHPVEAEGKMHAGQGASATRKPFGPYTQYLADQGQGLLDTFTDDYTKRRSTLGYTFGAWDSPLPTEHFEDAWIGRRAAQWIDEIPGDYPWHLFVSFVGPHDPYDPPTEYGDKYRDAAMPTPVPAAHAGKPPYAAKQDKKAAPEKVTECQRQYCAATELIDDAVAEILAALERKGELDNTYIVYASDHGEMLGDHGMWTKSVPYEASVRVPLIVAGPGLPQGQTSDALVELIDVNATLCEFAGLGPQEFIDARSMVPVLTGAATEHRSEQLSSLSHFTVLRTRDWKLIQNVGAPAELYDLQKDPGEQHNVLADHPAIVRDLSNRLSGRLTEGQNEW